MHEENGKELEILSEAGVEIPARAPLPDKPFACVSRVFASQVDFLDGVGKVRMVAPLSQGVPQKHAHLELVKNFAETFNVGTTDIEDRVQSEQAPLTGGSKMYHADWQGTESTVSGDGVDGLDCSVHSVTSISRQTSTNGSVVNDSAVSGQNEGLSVSQVVVSLVTTVIGCGVVTLPSLMRLGGWVVAPILACLTSLAFIEVGHVMHNAIAAAEAPLAGQEGLHVSSFEDLGQLAMGTVGMLLVRVVTTTGFCGTLVVYTILIGQNVHALCGGLLGLRWVMTLLLPVLLALTIPKDMNALAKLMPIGIIASLSSCVLICVKALLDAHIWQAWPKSAQPLVHSVWPEQAGSLGTVVAVLFAAYSVMGTVPVIRGSMRRTSEFPLAFRTAVTLVSATYISVMLLGYWGYGNFVQDNVVHSMIFTPASPREAFRVADIGTDIALHAHRPRVNILGTLMAVLVTTYLLLGFALFFACVVVTVQKSLGGYAPPGTLANKMLRGAMVLACVGTGLAVPHFREVMAIMASVCCSCNNVIFPLLFAFKLESSPGAIRVSFPRRLCHMCIVALALFCAIFGLHDSFVKLVGKMRNVTSLPDHRNP